jgi:hypothetical protein
MSIHKEFIQNYLKVNDFNAGHGSQKSEVRIRKTAARREKKKEEEAKIGTVYLSQKVRIF